MLKFLWIFGGMGFIFLTTCLGSATVFFFRKPGRGKAQKIFIGLAAGIMIAASVWSLLIPAIEEAEASGMIGWIPAATGFALGVLFLFGLDKLIPHFHGASGTQEGLSTSMKKTTLLVSAVTLHNIPEGITVGLSFALAAQHGDNPAMYAAAMALTLGIGIQNFPEGAVVSLLLHQEGNKPKKAFLLGCATGAVQPLFGIITVLLAGAIAPTMPWMLSCAAGAMMYVVVEELIPQVHLGEHSNAGTLGVMAGFLIMMILVVAFG